MNLKLQQHGPTPGPWTIWDTDGVGMPWIMSEDHAVAIIQPTKSGSGNREAMANARLIAASHDMFELIERISWYMAGQKDDEKAIGLEILRVMKKIKGHV